MTERYVNELNVPLVELNLVRGRRGCLHLGSVCMCIYVTYNGKILQKNNVCENLKIGCMCIIIFV